MFLRLFSLVLLVVTVSGCATAPLTLEEELQTSRATRNDIRDWDDTMRYLVGFQYANAALRAHEKASDDIASPSTTTASLNAPDASTRGFMIPLGIYENYIGNNFGSSVAFVDWFNSGMDGQGLKVYYYNRGLAFMAAPNTHYLAVVEGVGEPTEAEVRAAWQSAYELFSDVFNPSGDCIVFGWNERTQYSQTNPKDVPGRYKEILWECQHPFDESRTQRVFVSAFANPFPGARLIAAVQSQCAVEPEPGERYADDRRCGEVFASRHRPPLDAYGQQWMELTVTPKPGEPHLMHVVSRYGGQEVILPAAEAKDAYTDFLKARPYTE